MQSIRLRLHICLSHVLVIYKMGKDPKKPRGKMSSYAYFVQTCREEHKKKHPDASVNFAEFSKKCSERWKVKYVAARFYIFTILCNPNLLYFFFPHHKTMSPKEKGKFEDMAKQDKVRYEREMKNYVPPKGHKKKRFKDPNAPKRPPYVSDDGSKLWFCNQSV